MSGATKGGFNIGSVGGNASFSAGGDIVGGDKTTQTTTTTTVNNGFKEDDDKQNFLQQIDELRATLRELQTKTAEAPGAEPGRQGRNHRRGDAASQRAEESQGRGRRLAGGSRARAGNA